MNKSTKEIALQALLAAVYFTLILVLQPFAFAKEQFRIAEMVLILVMINKKNIIGIYIGTILASFLSFYGPIDTIVGSTATLIACSLMSVIKNKWLAYLMPSIVNGIIIGAMLTYVTGIPFVVNASSVFISEFIVTFIPWMLVGSRIINNRHIKETFG